MEWGPREYQLRARRRERESDLRRFGSLYDTNDLQWHPFELGRETYVKEVCQYGVKGEGGWLVSKTAEHVRSPKWPRGGARVSVCHTSTRLTRADCHRTGIATSKPNMGWGNWNGQRHEGTRDLFPPLLRDARSPIVAVFTAVLAPAHR